MTERQASVLHRLTYTLLCPDRTSSLELKPELELELELALE